MPVCEPLDIFVDIIDCHLSTVKVFFRRVEIDSRRVEYSDIFFALKGEHVDGNDFAKEAIEKGAIFVVMDDKEDFYELKYPNKILVKDSQKALENFGRYMVGSYEGEKIAVTGSAGKTSTKSMLASVIGRKYPVYESFKNFNNKLGVAYSASNIDLDSEYAIFELGTNSYGELKFLSEYIKPDAAVVTNIGMSHIGMFEDINALAREKLSILNSLPESRGKGRLNGEVWLHNSCKKYMNDFETDNNLTEKLNIHYFGDDKDNEIRIEEIGHNNHIDYIVGFGDEKYEFRINHVYEHFATNSLTPVAVGIRLNIPYNDIFEAIAGFRPLDGRGTFINKDGKVSIIDDSYNASFDSILAAIEDVHKIRRNKKYAVIGEMAEIGKFADQFCNELFSVARSLGDITFLFTGESYTAFNESENVKIFKNKSDLKSYLSKLDEGIFLVKASRSQKFEDIVEFLKEKDKSAV